MAGKLPAFLFYPGDWVREPSLRLCTHQDKGVFIDMLCLMFECDERGVLATGGRPWTDEQVSAAIGGPQDATLDCIRRLLAMGVVSRNQAGAILSRRMVRDEQARCANAERQRKHRNAQRNTDRNAGVTHHVTAMSEDETEDETENEDLGKRKAGYPDAFEQFWQAFPSGRRKGKRGAFASWERAVKRADSETIMAAAVEYAASGEGRGEFVKMPATWLNQDCWEDDRAAWNPSKQSGGTPQIAQLTDDDA